MVAASRSRPAATEALLAHHGIHPCVSAAEAVIGGNAAAADAQPVRRRITGKISDPGFPPAAEQAPKRSRDARGRFIPANPPPATVDETGAITSAPDPAAERARKRKEARGRAKAAAPANPKAKAKAKAKPRAKPKARVVTVANVGTKRAPRKTPQVQIVNAPPSAYVEPDEEDIGAHHATAASSTDSLPLAAKRARKKQDKDKGKGAKKSKKGGSVQNTIEEIIESSKLPPAEQSLLPPKRLTTKVARPKKGKNKKGGGLEPILEHNDVQDDPYYMKPPLPTQMK